MILKVFCWLCEKEFWDENVWIKIFYRKHLHVIKALNSLTPSLLLAHQDKVKEGYAIPLALALTSRPGSSFCSWSCT